MSYQRLSSTFAEILCKSLLSLCRSTVRMVLLYMGGAEQTDGDGDEAVKFC